MCIYSFQRTSRCFKTAGRALHHSFWTPCRLPAVAGDSLRGHCFSFPIRPIRPILSSGSQTTDSNGLLRQAAAFSLYLRFPSVKKSFGGGMQGGTLNCQGFPLFPLLATGGSPGVIQRRGVGRRNGEIKNAATESGVPGVYFIPSW